MTGLILAALLSVESPVEHSQDVHRCCSFVGGYIGSFQHIEHVARCGSDALVASLPRMPRNDFRISLGAAQDVPVAVFGSHQPHDCSTLYFTQDPVQQSKRHNWDLGLTFVSLTGSAIATGITAACTSTNECRELLPIMRRLIKESITTAIVVKSGLNAGMHFLILRYMPEGRWRTISLFAVAGVNWLDAGNDIREMRKIVRNR